MISFFELVIKKIIRHLKRWRHTQQFNSISYSYKKVVNKSSEKINLSMITVVIKKQKPLVNNSQKAIIKTSQKQIQTFFDDF